MSKVICDVCGTTYPENASQCPICGCAKSADTRTVTGDKVSPEGAAASSYQFVKGGRFSKRNVIKRNKQNLARQEKQPEPEEEQDEEEGGNKGLVIVLLLLLAAIIAVVIYIAVRFFGPVADDPGKVPGSVTDPTPSASTAAPTDPTEEPTAAPTEEPTDEPTSEPTEEPTEDPGVPCTGLSLRTSQILLEEAGSTSRITVSISPVNTTDAVSYVSDNEAVATVDGNGLVTAVGEGSARITVTCGSFEVYCNVDVVYATSAPTTEPTEPPTEPPTEAPERLELNRSDITMSYEGETWNLYSGNLALNKITWRSSNEDVVTVKNGTVTAVAPGTATVYAEYEGQEVSCIIRCSWEATEPPTEEPTLDPNDSYTISHTDVSISVGESFMLTLTNSSGEVVDVTWQATASGYVTISGNWITGAASINSGSFTVYTTVGGTTYSCIVRVK